MAAIPLNALRVFDAVARQLSMSAAGRELFITQGAVSQQIRVLEDYLGVRLFLREKRGLALTETGRRYFEAVSPALATLTSATEFVRRQACQATLVLSTVSSVAARWLFPRMGNFAAAEMRIDVSRRLVDFAREGVDLAIRHGRGQWSGLAMHLLFPLDIVGVAAPSHTSEDRRFLLDRLHPEWMPAGLAGIERTEMEHRAIAVDDLNVLIQAALDGHGIACLPLFLVLDDIERNRLVLQSNTVARMPGGYWLCTSENAAVRAPVEQAVEWLGAEAEETRARMEALLAQRNIRRTTCEHVHSDAD